MKRHTRHRRPAWHVLLASAVALVCAASLTWGQDAPPAPPTTPTVTVTDLNPAAIKPVTGRDRLGAHDRDLLQRATATGQPRVTSHLITQPGALPDALDAVTRLGGTVSYRNDQLGFARITHATSDTHSIAALPAVRSMDLYDSVRVTPPPPMIHATSRPATAASPTSATGTDNPFMPIRDLGLPRFHREHPTYDGRGITIGVLDSGVDLDHPALRTTSDGTPKITRWVSSTDPIVDNDRTWIRLHTSITTSTPTALGHSWTLPTGPDTWKIAHFEERSTLGDGLDGDVNRDGDTDDTFGVLYNTTDRTVYVDTDGDHDFTNNAPVRPLDTSLATVRFGQDSPSTELNESATASITVRLGVDLTPANEPGKTADYVNIGLPSTSHGTHVSGIAAGRGLFGGSATGAAPGATIVSSRACQANGSCSTVALTEGVIDLITRWKVNVVNMSLGGLIPLNDGSSARGELYRRLIATYGVPIVMSAGNNGPGLNTIGDPGTTDAALTVGASATAETLWANYNAKVSSGTRLQTFSSLGPTEDGGFKPTVVAPGAAISSVLSQLPVKTISDVGYTLPPGHAMQNGTSMAAPQIAGLLATLMSAAAQEHRTLTPTQWTRALTSSATWLTTEPAAGQGAGLANAPAAWEVARALTPQAKASVLIDAPVCTVLSAQLKPAHRGTGIYNRCSSTHGGQAAGSTRTYEVKITPTEGAPAGTYTVGWRGNQGTFSAPATVQLTPGTTTTLAVKASPTSTGLHSATMTLDHASQPGIEAFMMATVVVPQPWNQSFTPRTSGSLPRLEAQRHYVELPDHPAHTFHVALTGTSPGAQVRWLAFDPLGMPREHPTAKSSCYLNHTDRGCNARDRGYLQPAPGVWEVAVDNRRGTPSEQDTYRLTTALQRLSTSAQPATKTSDGRTTEVSWTVNNDFNTLHVLASTDVLGSARNRSLVMKERTAMSYTLDIPAGTPWLTASLGECSVEGADLDLVVLGPDGRVVALSKEPGCREQVRIPTPSAGSYTIRALGWDIAGKAETSFTLRDSYADPQLGSVTIKYPRRILTPREKMTVTASINEARPPTDQARHTAVMVTLSSTILGSELLTLNAALPRADASQPTRPSGTSTGNAVERATPLSPVPSRSPRGEAAAPARRRTATSEPSFSSPGKATGTGEPPHTTPTKTSAADR